MANLGHPRKIQRVSRLGSVTARHSSSEHQPNFAALNRGRHLYLAGRPLRWALAQCILVCVNLRGINDSADSFMRYLVVVQVDVVCRKPDCDAVYISGKSVYLLFTECDV